MPPLTESTEEIVFERLAGNGVVIDRENGIIKGVKVIGFESLNGRLYPPELLKKSVHLYEGAKVYVDHVDEKTGRKYRDGFGCLKNARFVEDKGIFADHHFNPKHETANQYLWDAENSPNSLGFSHIAALRFAKKLDAQGRKVVEEIGQVLSVDLVAEPATTKGLFESKVPQPKASEMDIKDLTLEQLQTARPDLVAALEAKFTAAAQDANEKATQRAALVAEELQAAGLDVDNKEHVSDLFHTQLIATEDASARKEMITDRAALVDSAPQVESHRGGLPMKPVTTGGGAGFGKSPGRFHQIAEAKTPKEFAAMYK